ncbi:MAG: hypothetical protein ACRES4_06820, partial [Nevskiales bacterium]
VRGEAVGQGALFGVWAERLLSNFSHDAFEPMLDVMEQALATIGPACAYDSLSSARWREGYARLRELPREWAEPLSRRKQARIANQQKFYGFEQGVIDHKMATIQKLLNKPLRYQRPSEQLVVMEAG